MRPAFYMDDTGSPGQQTDSKYLLENRKTWVAVFFTSDERKEATSQLIGYIEYIKSNLGANEFHFTDIYSGTKEYKDIDIDARLSIFEFFVSIYNKYKWRIFVQTVHNRTLLEHGIKIDGKLESFDLSDNNDLALFLLLIKCKDFLNKDHKEILPVDFIIDNGRQKVNSFQKTKLLENISTNSSLVYKSSKDDILIQIADFIAFCINKQQMIAVKKVKSNVDRKFLSIISNIEFSTKDLTRSTVAVEELTVDNYDNAIRSDKDAKNIMSDAEFEEIIKIHNKLF